MKTQQIIDDIFIIHLHNTTVQLRMPEIILVTKIPQYMYLNKEQLDHNRGVDWELIFNPLAPYFLHNLILDPPPLSPMCSDTPYALRYSNPLTDLTQSLKKLATTEHNHVKMQHN